VIDQADDGLGNGDSVSVAGLDRQWVVIVRAWFTRYDSCVEYGQRRSSFHVPLCGRTASGRPSLV